MEILNKTKLISNLKFGVNKWATYEGIMENN